MKVRRPGFVAFLFTPGTARFSRGVSVAWPGFAFSFNPRGITIYAGGRLLSRVWWPKAVAA